MEFCVNRGLDTELTYNFVRMDTVSKADAHATDGVKTHQT